MDGAIAGKGLSGMNGAAPGGGVPGMDGAMPRENVPGNRGDTGKFGPAGGENAVGGRGPSMGGRFEEVYNGIRSRIDILVKSDPTAFYSYEEYEAGAGMLYRTVLLRAESILEQLNGTIPSTAAGQRADASGLVDASGIDISVMGVFNMGRKSFQFNGVEVRFSEGNGETAQENEGPDMVGSDMPSFQFPGDAIPVMDENIPQDFRPPGSGVPGIPGNTGEGQRYGYGKTEQNHLCGLPGSIACCPACSKMLSKDSRKV